jgi:hypothetical protein
MKVYGPYIDKGMQRRVVILIYDNGVRETKSYARYLMEQHLGRKLEDWEEVDHIDDDKLNDDISNFQILTKVENIRKSRPAEELVEITCIRCGEKAIKKARNVRGNKKKGKKGPYCSRRCAGKDNN